MLPIASWAAQQRWQARLLVGDTTAWDAWVSRAPSFLTSWDPLPALESWSGSLPSTSRGCVGRRARGAADAGPRGVVRTDRPGADDGCRARRVAGPRGGRAVAPVQRRTGDGVRRERLPPLRAAVPRRAGAGRRQRQPTRGPGRGGVRRQAGPGASRPVGRSRRRARGPRPRWRRQTPRRRRGTSSTCWTPDSRRGSDSSSRWRAGCSEAWRRVARGQGPRRVPMADALYIHVGAPKAGSSYLQQLLFQHREALARQGVVDGPGDDAGPDRGCRLAQG